MNLSNKEIKQRLIHLSSVEQMYEQQRKTNKKLKTQNKTLKARIVELEKQNKDLTTLIQKLSLEMEELKTMVFGKKKERIIDKMFKPKPKKKEERPTSSYKREVPTDITKHTNSRKCSCNTCGTKLKDLKTRDFYIEDIILPTEKPLKTVLKQTLNYGYCTTCRTQKYSVKPPGATVTLGSNVKIYICYLAILLRLSYSQIHLHLKVTYNIKLSDGEIAKILKDEAKKLRPEYEALKESIMNQKGVHYDETTWKVQNGSLGNYAWVATGCENNDAVFTLGKSRGKGNAVTLKGDCEAVGISDDYGAYRTLFKQHQLCWAHPYRKLRDLATSSTLEDDVRTQCALVYQSFGKVYGDLRKVIGNVYDEDVRRSAYKKLGNAFDRVTVSLPNEPLKLMKIKDSLRKNREKYFTCLKYDGIPADNNKAERALRHLVLKRKMSFGSKTDVGADVTAVLASVLLSLWWRGSGDYFGELAGVRGV